MTPQELVEAAEDSGAPGLLAIAPGWERVPLGQVARVINGAPYESRLFNVEGRGEPLIRIRDVTSGKVSTWYDGPWLPLHRVERGAILIGMDGDFRASRWDAEPGLLNQRVCRLDVDPSKYDERFLLLVIQGYLDAIWKATSSLTVKHLSSRSIQQIPLPNPSLGEQRRIVETLEDHLSRLDAGAGLLTSVAQRGKMLELAALDALVPAESSSALMKDLACDAGYGTSTKCVADGPGVPVARIPNIVGGAIDMTDEKRAADPSVDLSGLMLKEGDVVFVRTNGSRDLIGRTAVVQQGVQASFASYLIRYQVNQSVVDPTWCHLMMNRASARVEIERLASSSAGQYNLSLGKISGLSVPLPELSVQRMLIEQYRASLDGPRRLVSAAVRAHRRSAALRRALLTAAFAGILTGAKTDIERVEEIAGV
ncbi:hypothetical protein IU11_01410 [Cellulosimicrobium sp. MM]|nr:hypothetical protein IU11_01410 [Cellulosimicrobium sp. MM]